MTANTMWRLFLACALHLSSADLAMQARAGGPVAKLACGDAVGTYEPIGNGSAVSLWRGIPYAAPPVGDLRWRSPQQPSPCWPSPLNATVWAPFCSQAGEAAFNTGQEDCLYLNVFAPSWAVGSDARLPVLAVIYGGGLVGGATNLLNMSAFVAANNVVAVTMNYRLNVFGYLATAELSEEQGGVSGNYGFQDQLLSLQWVQSSVAAFGGDPKRVTLMGQSSGGTSIFALLSAPASKGLFSAAIALSGSPNLTLSMHDAEQQNAAMVVQAACSTAGNSSAILACMRALPAANVSALMPNSWNTGTIFGMPASATGQHFPGVAIVDGVTVVQPFDEAFAAGLIDVPVIVGNMACEPDMLPNDLVFWDTPAQFETFLTNAFAAWDGSAGHDLAANYSAEVAINPQYAYDQIVADYGITCANAAVTAKALKSGQRKSSVYLFYNNWAPAAPVYTADPLYPARYPFHIWDQMAALVAWDYFNVYADGLMPVYSPAASDLALTALLQSAWVSLMTNGTVNPALGWQPSSAAGNSAYSTFVMEPPSSGLGSRMVASWKADKCAFFADRLQMGGPNGRGGEKAFWWCD